MYNPSYLMLSRHNLYYFRYPLPIVQASGRAGKDYIRMSLGTRDPKEALQLGKALEYYIAEITRRYGSTIMNDQEAKQLVSDYLKSKLDEQKKCIDKKPYYTDTLKSWSDAMKAIEADPAQFTEDFIGKLGLDVKPDSNDFQMLARYVKHNIPEYYKALTDYNTKAFRINMKAPKPKEVKPIHKLNDVIEKFLEASKTERSWGDNRRAEIISFLNTLKEILGEDFNTMEFDKERAGHVVDVIYKLPVNKEKNALTRGLGILEAIEVKGIGNISAGTIKKYLGAYSTFLDWCESRGYAESNHFTSLKANIVKGKQEKRYAFSEEEVAKILIEINNYPNGTIKKKYQYWGTLIAIYTGARLNEIAQLELDDIKQVDGVWCFDINDKGDKQVKTEASIRKVPIHGELIDKYHLLEYVAELKQTKKVRILHELSWSRGSYGRNLGRFFNTKLLPALGIKEKNVSFHCLRHTVNTRLVQADVEASKVKAILGHSDGNSMTERYAQEGFKLSQLREVIHKLPY